ncbi:MAG: biotin/lipoyl-binding protein, partial [Cyanobacteria bacterium SZAS LIN-3]|nr:biotin/lipoyl-binding protein [Cyanobacteria bacterium SZAS LIN-3]
MTASESPSSPPPAAQAPSGADSPPVKSRGAAPAVPVTSSGPPETGHRRPPILVILLVLLAAGGAYWYFTRPVVSDGSLHVSGRIEGYETNLGPKVGGRVDFISSREGEEVKKGQLLVKISDDDIQAQLRGARARYQKSQEQAEEAEYQIKMVQSQIDEARLSLKQSGEDARAQIDQAEANVAQAEARLSEADAQLAQAKADWELAKLRKKRFDELASKGAVSQDEDDQAVTTESTTRALVDSKASALQAAKKQLQVSRAFLNQARSTRLNPAMKSARLLALQQQLMQSQYSLKSARHD